MSALEESSRKYKRRLLMKWTPEEDARLTDLVKEFGVKRWVTISSKLPGRSGKQCRERWCNQLDPNIRRDPWTSDEEELLTKAHSIYGNKWTEIAKHIPGRTDNQCKNHFNCTRRRLDRHISPRSGSDTQIKQDPGKISEDEDIDDESLTDAEENYIDHYPHSSYTDYHRGHTASRRHLAFDAIEGLTAAMKTVPSYTSRYEGGRLDYSRLDYPRGVLRFDSRAVQESEITRIPAVESRRNVLSLPTQSLEIGALSALLSLHSSLARHEPETPKYYEYPLSSSLRDVSSSLYSLGGLAELEDVRLKVRKL